MSNTHRPCRDAECNICRGDTHVIGSRKSELGTCTWEGHGIPRFGQHMKALGCVDWVSITDLPSVHPLKADPRE